MISLSGDDGALAGAEAGDLASGVATPLTLLAVPAGAFIGGATALLLYKGSAESSVKSGVKAIYNAASAPVDGEAYDYFLQNGGGN